MHTWQACFYTWGTSCFPSLHYAKGVDFLYTYTCTDTTWYKFVHILKWCFYISHYYQQYHPKTHRQRRRRRWVGGGGSWMGGWCSWWVQVVGVGWGLWCKTSTCPLKLQSPTWRWQLLFPQKVCLCTILCIHFISVEVKPAATAGKCKKIRLLSDCGGRQSLWSICWHSNPLVGSNHPCSLGSSLLIPWHGST